MIGSAIESGESQLQLSTNDLGGLDKGYTHTSSLIVDF